MGGDGGSGEQQQQRSSHVSMYERAQQTDLGGAQKNASGDGAAAAESCAVFEILDGAFVFFCSFTRRKRAQIPAPSRVGIFFAGINTELSGF
jgi:hypothetical protein